jgi:hypothetical protein
MHKAIEAFLKTHGINDSYDVIKLGAPLMGYPRMEKDTSKYPYWRVNASSFDKDVAEMWNGGSVVLDHVFTPDSISMSKDQFIRYLKCRDTKIISDFDEWLKVEKVIEAEFTTESDRIEQSGKLEVGYCFYLGVADGNATYKVTKVNAKSVTVSLRKFGDGYRDLFLGCGRNLSMADFKSCSCWRGQAGKKWQARMSAFY